VQRVLLILLVLLLAGPAFGQNLIMNGGFESGLTGWKRTRLDGVPHNTAGVRVAPVLDGRPSPALFADYRYYAQPGVCCHHESLPFYAAAGSYVLRFDVLWQKPTATALPKATGNHVAVQVSGASFTAYVVPPGQAGTEERASHAASVILPKAGTYSVCVSTRHMTNPSFPFTVYVDNVSLGSRDGRITGSGSAKPGDLVDLDLTSPDDAGSNYALASSFGTGPIPIGGQLLRLSFDPLLIASAQNVLPSLFVNYRGTLDARGKARARIRILADGRLIGTRIYTAFIVIGPQAPGGVRSVSDTFGFTIT